MKRYLLLFAFLTPILFPVFVSADTIVVTIIDSHDDAEEDLTGPFTGDVRRTSSDLEIGNENGIEQWVGLRFQNLAIPVGATINSAAIKFTATETDVGVLIVPILGELSPNPDEFGDVTPLTTRPLTNASIQWNIDPWFPGDSAANTTTPNLTTIVQEIVDQSEWASGNSMVFLIQNDPLDTSERLAVSFDGDPLAAAELTIDFTPVPQITPDSFSVGIGSTNSGGLAELSSSDNQYLVLDPAFLSFRYQLAFTVDVTSPVATPSSVAFGYESKAFNLVGTVEQKIELFNYDSGQFESLDARLTSPTDELVEVNPGGDPTRFVQAGTNAMQAKISYQNSLPFWVFNSQNLYLPYRVRADQVFWTIK